VRKETNMPRLEHATFSRRLGGVCAVILCLIILFTVSAHTQLASASSPPDVYLSPSSLNLKINDTFTLTVSLSNFPDLYAYQGVLVYNGSVLNVTSFTFPANNVFSGYTYFSLPPPLNIEAAGAVGGPFNGLNFTLAGATLMGSGVSVAVPSSKNATLFQMNFKVVGNGQTSIQVATKNDPVYTIASAAGSRTMYTKLLDPSAASGDTSPITDFVSTVCSVASGAYGIPPIAALTTYVPPVNNKTYLILNQPPKPGVTNTVTAYKNLPVYFNASGSYPVVGNITAYIWNFGDGNITVVNYDPRLNLTVFVGNASALELENETLTVVNATAPADTFISHAYATVGIKLMSLTVVGEAGDTPPTASLPVSRTMLVGLTLEYYSWTWLEYTVFGIIVAVIVVYAARSVVRSVRRRRRLKSQKMLTAGPSAPGRTGARTT
jgi:hypothetical protein